MLPVVHMVDYYWAPEENEREMVCWVQWYESHCHFTDSGAGTEQWKVCGGKVNRKTLLIATLMVSFSGSTSENSGEILRKPPRTTGPTVFL